MPVRLPALALLLALAPLALAADPERHVPLEGTPNFRDLGGYKTSAGTLKYGKLYRAGTLEKLTEKDHETLKKLGIKSVVDLRTKYEVDKAADKLPEGIKYHHIPVGKDEDVKRYFDPKTAEDVDKLLKPADSGPGAAKPGYDTPLQFADEYAKLMALAADPANHPLVFHCTAGKDRTGVAAAVILWALGADDDTVAADYVLTDKYWKAESEKRMGELRAKLAAVKKVKEEEIDMTAMTARMGTKKETILGTKAKIEAECGTFDKFVADKLRLTDAQKTKFAAAVVEAKK